MGRPRPRRLEAAGADVQVLAASSARDAAALARAAVTGAAAGALDALVLLGGDGTGRCTSACRSLPGRA